MAARYAAAGAKEGGSAALAEMQLAGKMRKGANPPLAKIGEDGKAQPNALAVGRWGGDQERHARGDDIQPRRPPGG